MESTSGLTIKQKREYCHVHKISLSIEIILILYVFFSAKLAAAAAEKVANADGDLQDEHNRQFMNATEVTATNKNALFDAWHATYDSRKAEMQRKPKLDDFLNRYSLFLRSNETVIFFKTHRILKEVNFFFSYASSCGIS